MTPRGESSGKEEIISANFERLGQIKSYFSHFEFIIFFDKWYVSEKESWFLKFSQIMVDNISAYLDIYES